MSALTPTSTNRASRHKTSPGLCDYNPRVLCGRGSRAGLVACIAALPLRASSPIRKSFRLFHDHERSDEAGGKGRFRDL